MPNPAHVLDRHCNLVSMNDAARWVFGFDNDVRNCMVAAEHPFPLAGHQGDHPPARREFHVRLPAVPAAGSEGPQRGAAHSSLDTATRQKVEGLVAAHPG